MILQLTFANGLKQNPRDLDFTILPTIVFSRPPDDVTIIDNKKAFAFAFEWGHWAIVLWFLIIKK